MKGLTTIVACSLALGSLAEDRVIDLVYTGARVTVNVPDGDRYEIGGESESSAGVAATTVVEKTGAGTLVLPAAPSFACQSLEVSAGWVEVTGTSEAAFGASSVTVQGGGIRYTKSLNQPNAAGVPVTYVGTGYVDVPAGVTWGADNACFHCPDATVVKTGEGTWLLRSHFRDAAGADVSGATWVVDAGTLKLWGGDVFCDWSGNTSLTVELHENATMEEGYAGHHVPLCPLVLRGGTLKSSRSQFSDSKSQDIEGKSRWKGWAFVNRVTVKPPSGGVPSRVVGRACHSGHNGRVPTFDVEEGAVLEFDVQVESGRSSNQAVADRGGFVKTGKGTIRFLRHVGLDGDLDLRDGTVELAEGVRLCPNARVSTRPPAKVVLRDGALLPCALDAAGALLASADVWVDASRLGLADGATVTTVRNLGTAGGEFRQVNTIKNVLSGAPTYAANGIGGLGSLAFNGKQALVTDAYVNRGEQVQVFFVSRWTSWEGTQGNGRWGGPVSLCAENPTYTGGNADDNHCHGALSYQHGSDTTIDDLSSYTADGGFAIKNAGLSVGSPWVTVSKLSTGAFSTAVYLDNGASASGADARTGFANCDIDRVCLGGRLRAGAPQIDTWEPGCRMLIGEIGEFIVFSRALTDDETAAVTDYLRRKWLTSKPSAAPSADGASVNVEVASGDRATLLARGALSNGGGASLVKSGSGELRLGGALSGKAAVDVESGTLALGNGSLASFADVWVDAADETVRTVEGGRVVSLRNKGSAGGVFAPNARNGRTTTGPTVSADAGTGRTMLAFEGQQTLALDAYRNATDPREICVYAVARRASWADAGGQGKWSGAFSLARAWSETKTEEGCDGVCFLSDNSATTTQVDYGQQSLNGPDMPADGTLWLMAFQCAKNGSFCSIETAATDTAKVPRTVVAGGQNNEPFDISLVQLGGRISRNGGAEVDMGNATSGWTRMWRGEIAEFIVVTRPLGEALENELVAYLRKKWFGKGDGSATPPAWLVGYGAAPSTTSDTSLAMADGTGLVDEVGTLPLASLETAGTVDWTRVWSGAAGSFGMFSVAGDATLGTVRLAADPALPAEELVVGVAGARSAAGWVLDQPGSLRVARRADGFWSAKGGLVVVLR